MESIVPPSDIDSQHLLITGGTGFVGGHIINSLLSVYPNLRITIVDLLPPKPHYVLPHPSIKLVPGDVTSKEQILSAIVEAQPTIVIHTAGVVPTGNDRYTPSAAIRRRVWEINVEGTINVLEAAKAAKTVKAFVFTGSCTMISDDNWRDYPNMNEETKVLGEPLIYGKSKGYAESLVLAENSSSMLTCSIRPSVILGPGDYQLVPTIHRCIEKYETPFVIGAAQNLYDFTYVTNIADGHTLAVHNLLTTKTAAGEAFFISNGEPIPFRDFCLAIWVQFGHVPFMEVRIPVIIAWLLGALLEWITWLMGTEATLSRGSVRDYIQTAYADLTKARTILGYEPRVKLSDGIRMSCQEYQERLEAEKYGDKKVYGSKHIWTVPAKSSQHGQPLPATVKISIPESISVESNSVRHRAV